MDENTTHPNAYRVEAAEKRRLAAVLIAEADDLEATARALEGAGQTDTPAETEPEASADASDDSDSSRNKKKK